jgi:putative ABC transport system permease protein
MKWISGWLQNRRYRRELAEEMDTHLRERVDDLIESGVPETEAWHRARREFGNATCWAEAGREAWGWMWAERLVQDFVFGLRLLKRDPGFSAVAVMALAFGIGVNTAVFTIVNPALFKNLPFAASDRIFYISSVDRASGRIGPVSYPDYLDFRDHAASFEGMAAFAGADGNVSDSSSYPQSYNAVRITSNGFSVLGQMPAIGRAFLPEDEQPGAPPVAIISDRLWKSRYGQERSIVGAAIRLNGVPTTVIGVMDPRFRFASDEDFWMPLVRGNDTSMRDARDLVPFGRLAERSSKGASEAEIAAIARRLEDEYPTTNRGQGAAVLTFQEYFVGGKPRAVFLALLGAVSFVLLIACTNVANLLLVRAAGRTREISMRLAVGAGRWRIIRQLLVESAMLAIAGGAVGLLIAQYGVNLFDRLAPAQRASWADLSIDGHVLAYLAAVTIGTGILCGLAPAVRLSRLDLVTAIKNGGRSSGFGWRGSRLPGALVIAEVSLSVMLLSGAGLMIHSLINTYRLPFGGDIARILTADIDLSGERYARGDEQVAFFDRLRGRLAGLPGVTGAALACHLPGVTPSSFTIQFNSPTSEGRRVSGLVITPEYFRVLQAPPVLGREFREPDGGDGARSVLVNRSFAAAFWRGADPIGQRLRLVKKEPQPWLTVVGLVPDLSEDPNHPTHDPMIYLPLRAAPRFFMHLLLRTRVAPAALADAVRGEVQSLDPDLPVQDVFTLEDFLSRRTLPMRLYGGMFVIFALLALLLASVGMYTVVASTVSQRTREIGVRLTMGASRRDILGNVLARGAWQLAIGLALGVAGSLALTRFVRVLLVDVSAGDPYTLCGVVLALAAAVLLGCSVPAGRALRVDPAVTLRYE